MINEDHIGPGPAREDSYSRAKQGSAHPVTRKQKFRLFEFGPAGAGEIPLIPSKKEEKEEDRTRREGNNNVLARTQKAAASSSSILQHGSSTDLPHYFWKRCVAILRRWRNRSGGQAGWPGGTWGGDGCDRMRWQHLGGAVGFTYMYVSFSKGGPTHHFWGRRTRIPNILGACSRI